MPDKIVSDALDRFRVSQDASAMVRDQARLDFDFSRLGNQWPEAVRKQREAEGRPCLTINRLPGFIRQVVNDARQNKPAISVHPVDNGADKQTAEVIGGLIRAIERASNASIAYDTALEHAVTGGFGFFRVSMDYAHAESFDMEARIERVPSPFGVHWDPSTTGFDSSDWEFAFVSDVLTTQDFKKRYPKAAPVSFNGDAGATGRELLDEGQVRIAEYWLRAQKERKLLLLSDGSVIRADDLDKPVQTPIGPVLRRDLIAMSGVQVVRERDAVFHEVTRRVLNGAEVLEETPWPGSVIPICPVWGEEVFYEGRRHLRSLIRDARDPQLMFNYWRSASTELVALAPKAPFLVQEGAIPPEERAKWMSANTRSHAYLTFRGNMMPQRQPFAGVPAGALQEALNAADDMKAVIGIYDAALGARSNETSGRAILARQRESDVATFHFIDNLARAITACGKILVEIIPAIYSERQAIQILGQDEAEKVVNLTQQEGVPPSEGDPDGRLYNLSVGRYDVSVQTGPSYATQREETRVAMMEIMQQQPGAALVLGDILMQSMDFPQAEEAVKRVKLMQAIELAKAGLPPTVDEAIRVVESGQWPPRPQPQAPMMPPPPGGVSVPGGM